MRKLKTSKDTTRIRLAFFFRVFGIPVGEYEYRFHRERRWRFDHAWPLIKLAMELDGGQWEVFGGAHNRDKDRDKINTAIEFGWSVLRYSTQQFKNEPNKMAEQIKKCIQARKEVKNV